MVSVSRSAAAGRLSRRRSPGGRPGFSSAVLISTSVKATGIPSSRSRSSIIWPGESSCLTFAAGMRSAESTSIIHATGSPSRSRTRETRVTSPVTGSSSVSASSGVGDAAAELDPGWAGLTATFGEPGQEGAAALAPDQQSPADQSSYRGPDRRPGHAQAPHQLDFGGYPVADPVLPADQQVLQDLLRLRVEG